MTIKMEKFLSMLDEERKEWHDVEERLKNETGAAELRADVFGTFLKRVLVPKLRPRDFVSLDNLGAHRPGTMRRLVTPRPYLLFLVPYRSGS